MSYAGRTCSIWTGPKVSTITAINWFLFHQSFLRGKVLRRLQFLQVVIQRWIQRSVSLQQVATALGREPDWCWVLVPQDTRAATGGTDGHCGLENAAWWVLAPGSHRHRTYRQRYPHGPNTTTGARWPAQARNRPVLWRLSGTSNGSAWEAGFGRRAGLN